MIDPDDTSAPHGRAQGRTNAPSRGFLCTVCASDASASEMATFGARCLPCYREYCSTPINGPKIPAGIGGTGAVGRGWAERLRWREQRGEKLSPVQAEAWRSVLQCRQGAQLADDSPPIAAPLASVLPARSAEDLPAWVTEPVGSEA